MKLEELFKTKLTAEDYKRLNPPAILAYKDGVGMFQLRLDEDEQWLMVGHIPKPTTKLGWFTYHMIHGLAMRYPLLAVILWSFANMDMSDRAPTPVQKLPTRSGEPPIPPTMRDSLAED